MSDKPGVVRVLWWEVNAVVVILLVDALLLLMVVEKPDNPA